MLTKEKQSAVALKQEILNLFVKNKITRKEMNERLQAIVKKERMHECLNKK